MAIKASDFPRDKFAGYFEVIEGKGGEVTARVYPLPTGSPVVFEGKAAAAEQFVKVQMAKLKKEAE